METWSDLCCRKITLWLTFRRSKRESVRLKATASCRGGPGSGVGEPGRRAEEGAAGTGLLHVPAGPQMELLQPPQNRGAGHARATSSAARSPACTCLRGGCSVPQLHPESSNPSPGDRGHSLSISWPQHWVGRLCISSHKAAQMEPGVRASRS